MGSIIPKAVARPGTDRGLAFNTSKHQYYSLVKPWLNLALEAQIAALPSGLRHDLRQIAVDATTKMPTDLPGSDTTWRWSWTLDEYVTSAHPIWGTYQIEFHNVTIGAGADEFTVSFSNMTQQTNPSNGVYTVSLPYEDLTGLNKVYSVSLVANTAGRAMPANWHMTMVRIADNAGDPVDNLARYEGTGDYSALPTTDIRRWMIPEFLALYEEWSPEYLRFIKMCDTETGRHTSSGDYAGLGAKSWFAGEQVPYEVATALCNHLGCGLWWGMWPLADNDLIDEVAEYFRDNLDAPLKVYFEHGNEVWNNGYKLTGVVDGAGIIGYGSPTAGAGTLSFDDTEPLLADRKTITGVGTNFTSLFGSGLADVLVVRGCALLIDTSETITDTSMKLLYDPPFSASGESYYAYDGGTADYRVDGAADKIANLHARTAAVFSATSERDRLVNVIGGSIFQTFASQLISPPNSTSDVTANGDAISLNLYYGVDLYEDATVFNPSDGAAARTAFEWLYDQSAQSAANVALRDLMLTGSAVVNGVTLTSDKAIPDLEERLLIHRTLADANGLKLLSYEGGNHIIHKDADWDNDTQRDKIFALNAAFMSSSQCAELMNAWISLHVNYIDGPVMQFPFMEEWNAEFGVFSMLPNYGYAGDSRTAALAAYKAIGKWWE